MQRVLAIAVFALAACSPPAQKAPGTPSAAEAAAPAVTAGTLSIEDAIARPPIDGQTTGVGFLVVRNGGAAGDKLISASSPATSSIELHTHSEANGMMRMEKMDAVEIPAGGLAVFQPHGLHLMMFGFAATGETIPVTLHFEKGGDVTVPFKIMARSAGQGETGHASHEGHKH